MIKIARGRRCTVQSNGVQETWHFGVCQSNVSEQLRTLCEHESATIQQKCWGWYYCMKCSGFGVIYSRQVWVFLCWQRFKVSDHHPVGNVWVLRCFMAQRNLPVVRKERHGCSRIAYQAPGVQRVIFGFPHTFPTEVSGKVSFVMKSAALQSYRTRRCSSWLVCSPLCTCRTWKGAKDTDWFFSILP